MSAGSTLIGLDDRAGVFSSTTVDVPALCDLAECQAAEIEQLKAQRALSTSASTAQNQPPSETESDGPPSRAGAPGSSREPTAPMHVLENTLIARRQERAGKAQPRAHLDADELAIIQRTRALVRALDELRASVDLLDEQGRKMKAERDAALLEIERLKESLATACATGEPPTAEQYTELLDALAQIERMKPLVEAALKWDEEGASDDELLQAAQDYRDAEEGAS